MIAIAIGGGRQGPRERRTQWRRYQQGEVPKRRDPDVMEVNVAQARANQNLEEIERL